MVPVKYIVHSGVVSLNSYYPSHRMNLDYTGIERIDTVSGKSAVGR